MVDRIARLSSSTAAEFRDAIHAKIISMIHVGFLEEATESI